MALRRMFVARTGATKSAGLSLGFVLLWLLVQEPADALAMPPSEQPPSNIAHSEKRPTIDGIRALQKAALHAERKQKFAEASDGLAAALKSAGRRLPDTHGLVRRIRV